MKISVIVPTHNRREVLVSRTLPALFAQDLPAPEFEILIVVDGSTDGTAQALRELRPACGLRVFEQANGGPSAARNNGIQAATGELVLFIDDDILCAPDLLRQHVKAHASAAGPLLAFGHISLAPGTPPSILKYAVERWYQKYYGQLDSQGELNWPQDDYLISNSSLPRQTLIACGGFDENMAAKEDYELGLRLWKMGVPFRYLPQARAFEYYLKPSRYVLRNDGQGFGKTEVRLARKHPDYRPYSSLAALGKTAGWRRWWQRFYMALPMAPVGLLTPGIWICDRLSRFAGMRRVGHYLLGVGRGVVEFRSAAKEAGSAKTLRGEFGARLPVLLYHNVGPTRPGITRGLTVSPERFERHVRWLARRGYTGIGAADWARWRREGKGLPKKPVLFTFDDGYQDLVQHALPVLRRYGFGAVVYIVTGQLGGTNTWDAGTGPDAHRLMTAEQIRCWAAQGIEFGAHSRTHANLPTLSARELEEEVVGSGKDLAAIVGAPIVSFAYPFGFHNPAVDDCVRTTFELAFIADDDNEGLNHLRTDPHQLLRTMVQSDDSLLAVECRARWGRNPFLNWRGRVGLRTRLKRAARFVFARGKP